MKQLPYDFPCQCPFNPINLINPINPINQKRKGAHQRTPFLLEGFQDNYFLPTSVGGTADGTRLLMAV